MQFLHLMAGRPDWVRDRLFRLSAAGRRINESLDARIPSWYSVPLVRSLKVNDVVFWSLPFMWLLTHSTPLPIRPEQRPASPSLHLSYLV